MAELQQYLKKQQPPDPSRRLRGDQPERPPIAHSRNCWRLKAQADLLNRQP